VKGTSCGELPLLDDRRLHELIAGRAYELYEKRGSLEGYDCEDWLEAERQILAEVESKLAPLPRAITEHAA
jgi:DUF2934 family protein